MDLRILTAIDLYLNPTFYSNHALFVSLCLKYPNEFLSIDNLLAVSVFAHSVDSRKLKDNLVKYFSKSSRCKNLFSQPVKHWPDAVSAFKRHYHRRKGKINEHHLAVQRLHYNTWTIFSAVSNTMNGNIQNIDILINKEYEKEENQFFSITADEAPDCSNQEQISLIIKFIDSSFDVREEFIGFLHFEYGLSREALCKTILSFPIVDVKCIIVQDLLLVMLKSSKSMQTARSHKYDSATKKKLIDVCRTRWVERITWLDDFESLFVPIVFCLEGMSMNLEKKCNKETSSQASCFLKLITTFDFIASLVITRTVLDYTIPVTQMLQGKTFDICDGLSSISALKSCMLTLRNLIDDYHIKWYDTILCLASKVDVAEVKPRKSLTIPLIDHLLFEVNNRFSDDALVAYDGSVIIPDKMMSYASKKIDWKIKFQSFVNFYSTDLPCAISLCAELDLRESFWVQEKICLPDNISRTLPVSSSACERSFSAMRRLKNYTRSTMSSERMNSLALLHIDQEIEPNVEKVIDLFALKNRRLNFTDKNC
ncbi:52 kDa repressor of the inhibitor of the protein kinase-like [Hydra vulgaris]|uniref:52 kDa repressor of the inhibitor of the protein kinase-like n=1 Tax=Hydra vulgaris TaxID=6087 RepID=A0ABM4CTX9_HYDVU